MNPKQHTFRQSSFHSESSVRLNDEAIQLLDKNGAIQREVRFEDVTKIHVYDGGDAISENKELFKYVFARIVPVQGSSILFVSSCYIGLGGRVMMAKNHMDSFIGLLGHLKIEVGQRNPDAVLVYGDRGYSLLGYSLSLLFGLAFLAALLMPVFALYDTRLARAGGWVVWLGILLTCFISSSFFWSMAKSYSVKRTKLSEEANFSN